MSFKLDKNLICYFCAGARNHALLDFFESKNLRPEYDERMASFKALGLSKITKSPVVICTTSGTAVSQTVSALLEAKYSHQPLVLVTGDRPKKMHGTGAPQTISHQEVTENVVSQYIEVTIEELPDLEISNPRFPLHINVLINDTVDHKLPTLLNQTISDFVAFTKEIKSPLFLVSHENDSLLPVVERLKALNASVYAESLSGARHLTSKIFEQTLIRNFSQFDSVIRIGHTPLSKVWRNLESEHKAVFSFDHRNLSALSFGQVAPISGKELLDLPLFWQSIEVFKNTNKLPSKDIEGLLKKFPQSEPSVLRKLQDFIPTDSIVYLGNSLVIRYFEMVQTKKFHVFGTRGINGIDGQISQAIGLAHGTNQDVYCIIGDITAQYDLNALRHLPANLKVIVINNRGGRIFEVLKLRPIMVMEHDFTFDQIAKAFGISYSNELNPSALIELRPHALETQSFLREWNQ